jgi:uncharacterized protein YndB with AHSA1/START domain
VGSGPPPVVVSTPSAQEIRLCRDFDAPAPLVFDAFTRPDLLRRWYGARGWWLVECEVDLRVGGRWRFVSHGPDGGTMGQGGVYRVVRRPYEVVFTELYDDQSFPGESLVRHEFVDLAGTTSVTSTVRYATREGRDTVLRRPMARGVGEAYVRLAALLAEPTSADPPAGTILSGPDR